MDGWTHIKRLSLLAILFGPVLVFGAERLEFYNAVRALGMGGASVAVVSDETALLLNPAALGKVRGNYMTLVDPEIELGAQTQSIIGSGITTFMDPQDTLDAINAGHRGKQFHQRVQLFPSIVVQNFGVGIYGRYATDAFVDTAGTAYELNYRNDFALVFGFNFRIWDGRIKFGFNVRGINRVEINRNDLSPAATNLTLSSLASEGAGIGSDVGLVFAAPWSWLPTLSAVYRDVGKTRFDLTNGLFMDTATTPNSVDETCDVGFAVFPILGRTTRMSITAEYRDVLTYSDVVDHNRRTHYGMELNFNDAFFIRGGMHQNYYTAGLELAMMNYQFQAATYAEEIGTAAAPQKDRRFVGKIVFRF